MRGLLVFAAVVSCCVARPDIGLKLREQALKLPSTNYGVPTGGYLPPTGVDNSGSNQHHYYQSGPSHTSSIGGTFGGSSQGPIHTGFTGSQQPFHTTGGSSFHSGSTFESGSHSSQGSSVVAKHVYFFDSPEDIPAPKIRSHQQHVENKKNYKIVFIKAPTYKAPEILLPSAQEQSAEKTLIYVLVKKPEEVKDIEIPSVQPTKPSKPEVFFIKYKTQKEAQEKIEHIQNGGSADGIVSTDLGNDANFVNTIRDGSSSDHVITIGSGHDSGSGIDHISTITGHGNGYEHSASGSSGNKYGNGYEHSTSGSSGSGNIIHQQGIVSQSGPY